MTHELSLTQHLQKLELERKNEMFLLKKVLFSQKQNSPSLLVFFLKNERTKGEPFISTFYSNQIRQNTKCFH